MMRTWRKVGVRGVLAGGSLALMMATAVSAQVFLPFRFRVADEIPLQVGEDVGTQPMTLADVNNDDLLDLVAILQEEGQVAVLLNRGGGEFDAPRTFDTDVFPTAIAVADIASDTADSSAAPDGNPDIILASDDGYPVLLLGDGEGGFSGADAQDLEELVEGFALVGVAVADFDANGFPDLAFADAEELVYFLCNDQGTFADCPSSEIATVAGLQVDIDAGDFDGDGKQDVAVLNQDAKNVAVIYGGGDGSFADPRTFPASVVETNEPSAMTVGRLDGGVTDDLVIVNREDFDSLGVLVMLGIGKNRFDSTGYTVPFDATGVAVGTLDGDGEPDIAIASDEPSSFSGPTLLAGIGSGAFDQNLFSAPGAERLSRGRAILAADVGGDPLPDLVQLHADGDLVGVAINISNEPRPSATPTFTSPPPPTGTPPPNATVTATGTSTPTATLRPGNDDDGCAVGSRSAGPAFELIGLLAALLLARSRRTN